MPQTATLFDCEFLTAPGAPQRFWCGPNDPDPIVVQIGAVKLNLAGPYEIGQTFRTLIRPLDRHGNPIALDPLFVRLTGITEDQITTDATDLATALDAFSDFAGEDTLWSWGKDEFNMLAISCYVANIPPPIPATRFRNACDLVLKAGMPLEDLHQTRSNTLADYYKVDHPPLEAHDALGDALSVAYALQHLLHTGELTAQHFA